MSSLKATRFVLVAIFVLSCVFMNIMKVEAQKRIGYPAIGRGRAPGCSPKYPSTCRPKQPVNQYKRGCNKNTRCKRIGNGKGQAALRNNI
ncbi:PREDICTED: protein RALF-like 2 [Camelina sativa]|uniref:Protein RALF-like 2 n=1 Tax=Camelina sativa TaxID=90675 RepID=A0ABM1R5Z8_CAMSA|nr:PREDICTED: protein RALF-like 2 [Camelina sativa]